MSTGEHRCAPPKTLSPWRDLVILNEARDRRFAASGMTFVSLSSMTNDERFRPCAAPRLSSQVFHRTNDLSQLLSPND